MLTDLQIQHFERLYAAFDKNGSGSLDEADFMKAFEGVKANFDPAKAGKIDQAARRWFSSIYVFANEGDRDRKLSKEEWLAWADVIAADTTQTEAVSRKYGHFTDAVFEGITLDDLVMSAEEYHRWFQSFGLSGDAANIFQQLDANGNGELTKDEFLAAIKQFVTGDASAAGHRFFGEPLP